MEAAARLLNRYREAGLNDESFGESFIMSVRDHVAVAARAAKLRPDLVPLPAPRPGEPDRRELARLPRLIEYLKETGQLEDRVAGGLIGRASFAARGDRALIAQTLRGIPNQQLVNEALSSLAHG